MRIVPKMRLFVLMDRLRGGTFPRSNRNTIRTHYTMPERYHNSFYHANAQLFECVNYYLHAAYEIVFDDLVDDLAKGRSIKNSSATRIVYNVIDCMENCNDLIDVHLPVKMNDGNYKVCRGFRAHHGLFQLQRPCLGGFRICCDTSRDHVKALASLTTYKNACIGVHMAGAHGALRVAKDDYREEELRKAMELYGRAMDRHLIHDVCDVYEPDMYCKPEELQWLEGSRTINNAGRLFAIKSKNYPSVLGHCPFFVLKQLMDDETLMASIGLDRGLKDKTFICDGLGKMGVSVCKQLEEAGARCVGFRETDCYLYDSNGFSVNELMDYKRRFGSFKGYSNGITECESQSVILVKECDLLVLCSSHKVLNCYMAESVQAKIVLECASLAITPTAQKILIGGKRLVVPDVLATAGVSLANYFTYMNHFRIGKGSNVMEQNLMDGISKIMARKPSTNDNAELFVVENILSETIEAVMETTDSYKLNLDLRTAAYVHAIKRLFKSIYDNNKY